MANKKKPKLNTVMEEEKLPVKGQKSFKDKLKEKGMNLKLNLAQNMTTLCTTTNVTKKEPIPNSALSSLSVSSLYQ